MIGQPELRGEQERSVDAEPGLGQTSPGSDLSFQPTVADEGESPEQYTLKEMLQFNQLRHSMRLKNAERIAEEQKQQRAPVERDLEQELDEAAEDADEPPELGDSDDEEDIPDTPDSLLSARRLDRRELRRDRERNHR